VSWTILKRGLKTASKKTVGRHLTNIIFQTSLSSIVNILGGSTGAVKENAEVLVVAAKEIGLEVNADKTKYMVTSLDQNAGRGHSVKIDNSSFERVDDFKYL
jgi:hypothetical protein